MNFIEHGPAVRSVARSIVYIAVVAAPVAIGGVHFPVALALALLGLAAFFFELQHRRGAEGFRKIHVSRAAIAFLVLGAVAFLQLIPLPRVLHELLNPTGAALFAEGWQAAFGAQAPDTWRALSLDPAGTADRAVRWVALAALCAVAANAFRSRSSWRKLVFAILSAGYVVLGIGLLQRAFGDGKLLGFYEPSVVLRQWGTFVNPNHAAVFFGFVSLVGFALAAARYDKSPAETLIGAATGLVFMIVMTFQQSLGAFIAFGAAAVVLGMGIALQAAPLRALIRANRKTLRNVGLGVGALLLAAAAAVVTVVAKGGRSSEWLARLEQLEAYDSFMTKLPGRVELFIGAMRGSADFWLTGAGAGSADRSIGPYLDWASFPRASVPTVENELAEWAFTLGLPVTIIAVGLLAWAASSTVRRFIELRLRSRRMLSAVSVGLYLILVAQIHFPFLVLGAGLPIVIFVVSSASHNRKSGARSSDRGNQDEASQPSWLARYAPEAAVGAGVLAVVVCGSLHWGPYADPLGPLLKGEVLKGEVLKGEVLKGDTDADGATARAVELIPSESRLYARLSTNAKVAGEFDRAFELARRAHRLKPDELRTLFLARAAARAGDDELSHKTYREFFATQWHAIPADAFSSLVRDIDSAEARAAIVAPSDKKYWWRTYDTIKLMEGPAAASTYALALAEHHPDAVNIKNMIIDAYLDLDQLELAGMWAQTAIQDGLAPDEGRGLARLVAKLLERDRRDQARAWLGRAVEAGARDFTFMRYAKRLVPADPQEATEDDARLAQLANDAFCVSPLPQNHREDCWSLRAWLLERDGQLDAAQTVYERIYSRLEQPRSLAQFLTRHYRCGTLDSLAKKAERRHKQQRAARLFRKHATQCAAE
ncbi:MAG: hypothetical protein ACLFVJ_11985 [Persicimonas sp.]